MRITRWGGGVALGLAAGALALAGPAAAQGDWSANGESAVVDSTTVRLEGANTSVETGNLGINVDAGTDVSFDYELVDGALCEAGAPRVFLIVDGTNNKSEACDGTGLAETSGTITFTTGNAGLITGAGVVYDSGRPGHVLVSDLTIAGEPVLFQDPPAPSPSPTGEPTPDPEPTKPAPAPSDPAGGAGGGDDKPGLPVTGASVPLFVAIGGGAAGLGGLALWLTRRRRAVSFTA